MITKNQQDQLNDELEALLNLTAKQRYELEFRAYYNLTQEEFDAEFTTLPDMLEQCGKVQSWICLPNVALDNVHYEKLPGRTCWPTSPKEPDRFHWQLTGILFLEDEIVSHLPTESSKEQFRTKMAHYRTLDTTASVNGSPDFELWRIISRHLLAPKLIVLPSRSNFLEAPPCLPRMDWTFPEDGSSEHWWIFTDLSNPEIKVAGACISDVIARWNTVQWGDTERDPIAELFSARGVRGEMAKLTTRSSKTSLGVTLDLVYGCLTYLLQHPKLTK